MPIRTQSDLPAKEILEQENIFVMDESRAMHQVYSSDQYRDSEPDATERRDGIADFSVIVKHPVTGRRIAACTGIPCIHPYFKEPPEQVLSDVSGN